jgi:hypothetical protein
MWTFFFSFLFLKRLRIARPIRYVLAVLMIGLILVVLIYTANLFLTLSERTSPHHEHTHSHH